MIIFASSYQSRSNCVAAELNGATTCQKQNLRVHTKYSFISLLWKSFRLVYSRFWCGQQILRLIYYRKTGSTRVLCIPKLSTNMNQDCRTADPEIRFVLLRAHYCTETCSFKESIFMGSLLKLRCFELPSVVTELT